MKLVPTVDSYHLTNMLGNVASQWTMGPVDLWAMTQKVEMPFYTKWHLLVVRILLWLTMLEENTSGKHLLSQELPVSMGKTRWYYR